MSEQEAVRRLVKSGPELWAQCSDPSLLSRHLAAFGEIKITRLEPESTVAWEGESVSGTVSFEPAGWGTRVRLTAVPPADGAVPVIAAPVAEVPAPVAKAAPVDAGPEAQPATAETQPTAPVLPEAVPAAQPRRFGALFSALLNRRREAPVLAREPQPAAVLEPEPARELPPAAQSDPAPMPEPELEPAPPAAAEATTPAVTESLDVAAELEAALDSLGAAHHRPYSRS